MLVLIFYIRSTSVLWSERIDWREIDSLCIFVLIVNLKTDGMMLSVI